MRIKLLQLNIYQGKLIDNVIKFVQDHDVDIVNLQEVTGGGLSLGGISIYPGLAPMGKVLDDDAVGRDTFEYLKSALHYNGELNAIWRLKNDLSSYEGNAIIFNNTFQLIDKKEVWFKPYEEYDHKDSVTADKRPRGAIYLRLKKDDKEIGIVTTHLAWGPTPLDEPYKLEQNKKMFEFVKTIDKPFVLTGDFNLTPDSQVVSWLNGIARNWTVESKTTNTLNPEIHVVKKLFPKGHAVDYIFTSPKLNVKYFKVIREVNLSDHYGLLIEFEL